MTTPEQLAAHARWPNEGRSNTNGSEVESQIHELIALKDSQIPPKRSYGIELFAFRHKAAL